MTRVTLLGLVCATLLAADAEARRKEASHGDPASRAFAEGMRLYKQMDYQAATDAFQRAYKLKPHYLVMCNIARCRTRMNDMVKAAEAYRRCLREGGGETKLATSISERLAKIEARITALTVTSVGKGGKVLVDGIVVGATPAIVPLNPGKHVIEVRREGAKSAIATVEGRGGQSSLELNPVDLSPAAPVITLAPTEPQATEPGARRSGLSTTWFWVGTGATVAVAAAATVMSVLTLRANSDFDKGPTWDGYHKVIDYRLVTNVLWGTTAALGATTTVLFFFTDFGGSRRDRGGDAATLGIGITGSF